MAMDSYMKGVAGSPGNQGVEVRPAGKEQKAVTSANDMQKNVVKKPSAPKSSIRKTPVKKSSIKKTPLPTSSVKKAVVSNNSVQKMDKVQADGAVGTTEQENKDVFMEMEKEPTISTIDSAISAINAQMSKTRCAYAYDEVTKRITIKVYDDETDELIREVPPEKSLDILKRVWERIGIMMDEKF